MDTKLVEMLAARKGVKRVAVENFLYTMDGLTHQEAIANMELDARLYGWNAATKRAICDGIIAEFQR